MKEIIKTLQSKGFSEIEAITLYELNEKNKDIAVFLPGLNYKKAKQKYPMLLKRELLFIPLLKNIGGLQLSKQGMEYMKGVKK